MVSNPPLLHTPINNQIIFLIILINHMLMTTFYILYNTVAISTNIVGYKFKLYTVFI